MPFPDIKKHLLLKSLKSVSYPCASDVSWVSSAKLCVMTDADRQLQNMRVACFLFSLFFFSPSSLNLLHSKLQHAHTTQGLSSFRPFPLIALNPVAVCFIPKENITPPSKLAVFTFLCSFPLFLAILV